MKRLKIGLVVLFFGASSLLMGQNEARTEKEEITAQLMALEGEWAPFAALLEQGKKAGMSEQQLTEVNFLYWAERADAQQIAALLPRLEAILPQFSPDQSLMFSTLEDFQAVVEYSRALKALGAGDRDGFKKHITEAFWLSPRQAGGFAPHIEEMRLVDYLSTLKINWEQELRMQGGEGEKRLSSLRGEGEGLLLYFWSPWNAGSEAQLKVVGKHSKEFAEKGLKTASVLAQEGEENLEEAVKWQRELEPKAAMTFLIDRAEKSLSTELRVTGLPTAVIIDRQGKVIFHGSMDEQDYKKALKMVMPDWKDEGKEEEKPADEE